MKVLSSAEYLSGFRAEDKVLPVITATILFSAEPWNGPRSLHEMLNVSDPAVLACIDNYHLRLIAPAEMSDEEINGFHSSLRDVLLFIKHSKNAKDLARTVRDNSDRFEKMERRAADVIQAITNVQLQFEEENEVIDMCQALVDIKEEGKEEMAQDVARSLAELGFDTEKIAQIVNFSPEKVQEWLDAKE